MRPARLLLLLLLGGAAAIAFHPRPPASAAPAPDAGANENRKDKWMGVATCSAAGCHHGNGPREQAGSEYSTWAAHDKHAKAFAVLYDDRSQRMVTNLCGDKAKHATETPLCLGCHAMNDGKDQKTDANAVGERFWVGDGVGCECCHGPAERYLSKHYRAEVQGLSKEEKGAALSALGMKNTKDLGTRAQICAECHVGTKDKDVNHDLIAAGHPRLNFEFSAFLALYPRHWTRQSELARHPDFEARAWAVGQVASAQAALRLLEARAGDPNRPWPEFAEYNCYACHKDLKAENPGQKSGFAGRRAGAMPWGTWYFSELLPLAKHEGVSLTMGGASVDGLREQMQAPDPSRKAVGEQAAALTPVLDAWLRRLRGARSMPAGQVRGLMGWLAADAGGRAPAMSWDEASEAFLALAALHAELSAGGRPPLPDGVLTALQDLRKSLKDVFQDRFTSPRRFLPSRLVGPFQDIGKQLGNK